MPSVFAISGYDDEPGKRCKWVRNPRTGCTTQLCYVGKSRKSPSGWQFQRGTARCSGLGGTRKRRRRRKRK